MFGFRIHSCYGALSFFFKTFFKKCFLRNSCHSVAMPGEDEQEGRRHVRERERERRAGQRKGKKRKRERERER